MKPKNLVALDKVIALSVVTTTLNLGIIPPGLTQTISQTVRAEISWETIPWISGGDADVTSKSGRKTFLRVSTSNLNNYGRYFTIDVEYDIREGRSNYTHLRRTESYNIPVPGGFCVSTFGLNKTHTNYSSTYVGQFHGALDISGEENVRDTYLENVLISFDGKGDDNQGNANLKARIVVPVEMYRCL